MNPHAIPLLIHTVEVVGYAAALATGYLGTTLALRWTR